MTPVKSQKSDNPFRIPKRFIETFGPWIVILLAIILAVINSVQNPPFESPDELEHYQFVQYLVNNQTLPIQPLLSEQLTQFQQPPLYYLIGALLVAPIQDNGTLPSRNPHWTSYRTYEFHNDNKAQFIPSAEYLFPYHGTALVLHLLRLWSVVLLIGTLIITYKFGQSLWPGRVKSHPSTKQGQVDQRRLSNILSVCL